MDPTPLNELAYIVLPECVKEEYMEKFDGVAPQWPHTRRCCEALKVPSRHPLLQYGDGLSVVAATNGHMYCLTRVAEKGLRWSADTCNAAVAAGNVEMLLMLLDCRCPYDGNRILEVAATIGRIDIISIVRQLNEFYMFTIPDGVMEAAAKHGHVDCMMYLMQVQGAQMTRVALWEAAAAGHVDAVRYAYEVGFWGMERRWHGISALIASVAAANGRTACVVLIHELVGGRLPNAVGCAAARTGNLVLLRYCAENDNERRRTVDTCTMAAAFGQHKCLVYAHRRGYPWDGSTYRAAFASTAAGRDKCLAYLRRHRCPSDE